MNVRILLCLMLVFFYGCSGYVVTVKTYNSISLNKERAAKLGPGSTILSYDTLTQKIVVFDFDKRFKIIKEFYYCFFPDATINPSFYQSKLFDREEFYRLCSLIKYGPKECKQ